MLTFVEIFYPTPEKRRDTDWVMISKDFDGPDSL